METSQVTDRNYTHVKDKQICLDGFSPSESNRLMEFVNGCLYYYINEFSYLTNFNYVSSLCSVAKNRTNSRLSYVSWRKYKLESS